MAEPFAYLPVNLLTTTERKTIFGGGNGDVMNNLNLRKINKKINRASEKARVFERTVYQYACLLLGHDLAGFLLQFVLNLDVWEPRWKLNDTMHRGVIVYFGDVANYTDPMGNNARKIDYSWNYFSFFSLRRYFERKAALTNSKKRAVAFSQLAWQCDDPKLYDTRMVIVNDYIANDLEDEDFDPMLPYIDWNGEKIILPINEYDTDDDHDIDEDVSSTESWPLAPPHDLAWSPARCRHNLTAIFCLLCNQAPGHNAYDEMVFE